LIPQPKHQKAAPCIPAGVAFDESCSPTLRQIFLEQGTFFVEAEPSVAQFVIFGSDEIDFIRDSSFYRTYKTKAFCVTETDTPTFRIPGLYAANNRSSLARSRTRTINYLISERDRGNPEIKALVGRQREKRYLYSFMGGPNSWVRKRLFKALSSSTDTLIESTDSYNHWDDESDASERKAFQMRRYAEVLASSKFVLCPRGCGLSSYRLFETMSLGVAPVLISNNWKPVELVDWSFALIIRENQISLIDQIVRSHEHEWQARGRVARETYVRFFSGDAIAATLYHQLANLQSIYAPSKEPLIGVAAEVRAATRAAYWQLYRYTKQLVLMGFRLTGTTFPVKLYQPVGEPVNRAREISTEG
jgi:hypothetical protein